MDKSYVSEHQTVDCALKYRIIYKRRMTVYFNKTSAVLLLISFYYLIGFLMFDSLKYHMESLSTKSTNNGFLRLKIFFDIAKRMGLKKFYLNIIYV